MAELARLRAQRQSSPGGTKVFPNPEDDYEHGMRAHFPATFSRKAAEGPEIMKLHENMRRGQSTKDDKTDDGGEIAPEEQNPVSSSRDETVWPPVDDASPSWDGMNDDEVDRSGARIVTGSYDYGVNCFSKCTTAPCEFISFKLPSAKFPSAQNVHSYGQPLNLSAAGIEPSRSCPKGVKTTHDVPMDSLLDKYKIPRQPGRWKSLLSEEARGYLEPTSNWHSNRSNQYKPAQLLHGYEKSGGRDSLAFGPEAGHGVPNWRDLIGRSKPRFSGERVDFTHVQPGGNANSVEIPAEGMS
ncbi:hypothetical protein BSKO_08704 [Bryopsis sp. KO-2023]|nr:hypothetical protein BSKO_08704 [Bryopsis sp. KO-2023]